MNGNTSAKVSEFSQSIISAVQISSVGISDTPFKLGRLQIFSVVRGLSPTSKSEKRVVYEIVWISVVYLSQMHCTHRGENVAGDLGPIPKFLERVRIER